MALAPVLKLWGEISVVNRNEYKKALELCRKKFDIHMQAMHDCMPYELNENASGVYYDEEPGHKLSFMYNWVTSFVTGLAPIYYELTGDVKYLKWANGFEKYYYDKVFLTPMETMHDLGFLYIPYSIKMYKLTGNRNHREAAIKATDELVKRFEIRGRYIDAWRKMDEAKDEGRAIIDCMMNLELLFWAWKETGHTMYRDVAIMHAETTIKYFIREDLSVAHSFEFSRATGELLHEANACGYANGSYWARGTAWAVYGFALAALYTGDARFIKTACDVADKYMSMLDENVVPVWDFRLPKDMPAKACSKPATWDETKAENCCYNVDSSAAAIIACGMMCIYDQTGEQKYLDFAAKTADELVEKYLNSDQSVAGLLKAQNGNMCYTTYGDYYFVELLQRLIK